MFNKPESEFLTPREVIRDFSTYSYSSTKSRNKQKKLFGEISETYRISLDSIEEL
jgi:hypothetical protein